MVYSESFEGIWICTCGLFRRRSTLYNEETSVYSRFEGRGRLFPVDVSQPPSRSVYVLCFTCRCCFLSPFTLSCLTPSHCLASISDLRNRIGKCPVIRFSYHQFRYSFPTASVQTSGVGFTVESATFIRAVYDHPRLSVVVPHSNMLEALGLSSLKERTRSCVPFAQLFCLCSRRIYRAHALPYGICKLKTCV